MPSDFPYTQTRTLQTQPVALSCTLASYSVCSGASFQKQPSARSTACNSLCFRVNCCHLSPTKFYIAPPQPPSCLHTIPICNHRSWKLTCLVTSPSQRHHDTASQLVTRPIPYTSILTIIHHLPIRFNTRPYQILQSSAPAHDILDRSKIVAPPRPIPSTSTRLSIDHDFSPNNCLL